MVKSKLITATQLREILHYDPETGGFTWLVKPRNNRTNIGAVAGTMRGTSGRYIVIDRHGYRESRLAWLYMTRRVAGARN